MLNNRSSEKLLLEVIQQANNRDWIEEYLDLIKELIEFTGLDNDDPRLVLSLAKSKNFPVTINARYVLAGFRKGKPLVRFIFPYDCEEITQLLNSATPPELSYQYNPLGGEDREKTPYRLAFPGYPQKLLTLTQKAAWKKAILSEVERYERSPHKKFHESIVYDVVVDLNYRKSLLDQVFPVQDTKVNNKEPLELLEQRKIIESANYFNPENIEDARKTLNCHTKKNNRFKGHNFMDNCQSLVAQLSASIINEV